MPNKNKVEEELVAIMEKQLLEDSGKQDPLDSYLAQYFKLRSYLIPLYAEKHSIQFSSDDLRLMMDALLELQVSLKNEEALEFNKKYRELYKYIQDQMYDVRHKAYEIAEELYNKDHWKQ